MERSALLFKIVFNYGNERTRKMSEKSLNQEELLKILMHAYTLGEESHDMTATELLEDLILKIKNGYVV
jgi:hypothetical protein